MLYRYLLDDPLLVVMIWDERLRVRIVGIGERGGHVPYILC